MKYSQAQVREILGVGPETLRHWRRVLSPLQAKAGRTPLFTFGDIVAVAVAQRAVERLGLNVGHLRGAAAALFDLCNRVEWASAEDELIVIAADPDAKRSAALDVVLQVSADRLSECIARLDVAAVVPLRAVLDQVRLHLVLEAPIEQRQLPFPPTPLRRAS